MNKLSSYNDIQSPIFDFNISDFEAVALNTFRFQYNNNSIYKKYTDTIGIDTNAITAVTSIPFLPIRFFKTHAVQTTSFTAERIFESSGTTQTNTSRHFIKDISLYTQSFLTAFGEFYGDPQEWCIIGLLPSYLERQHSSLVLMTEELIRKSSHEFSGFYLYEYQRLAEILQILESKHQKTLVIGVTFALLDFAEKYPMRLKYTTIMETGGMKGRREEITRQEVHSILKNAFQLSTVHSEYGMTELLSQAYSKMDGLFYSPKWMKILVRTEDDPFDVQQADLSGPINGILNVIDLANIYSCSFIATEDAGKLYGDGSFEVLGRVDNSDIRGCSLMVV